MSKCEVVGPTVDCQASVDNPYQRSARQMTVVSVSGQPRNKGDRYVYHDQMKRLHRHSAYKNILSPHLNRNRLDPSAATTLADALAPLSSTGTTGLAVVAEVTVTEVGTSREAKKANSVKTVTMIGFRHDRTLRLPRQDGFAMATGFLDAALI
jgi:hypothetical protein